MPKSTSPEGDLSRVEVVFRAGSNHTGSVIETLRELRCVESVTVTPGALSSEEHTQDPGVHACEYLRYSIGRIELVYPNSPYQRWIYINGNGLSFQVILFCPFCGEDFRADCHWQIPGRPQENGILDAARKAGLAAKEAKHE